MACRAMTRRARAANAAPFYCLRRRGVKPWGDGKNAGGRGAAAVMRILEHYGCRPLPAAGMQKTASPYAGATSTANFFRKPTGL